MTYKEKLIQFNSTEKYMLELQLVTGLLGVQSYSTILDYGCGLGTAVHYFRKYTCGIARGYDIHAYDDEQHFWRLDEPPKDKYHHITFIHSLAHIHNAQEVIERLRNNLVDGGKITVLTPNLNWINTVGDTKSDPTVVKHYNSQDLRNLFKNYKVIHEGQHGEVRNGHNERIFIQVGK